MPVKGGVEDIAGEAFASRGIFVKKLVDDAADNRAAAAVLF